MKRKLLWKGTLKEMRENICYKYAIDEVLEIIDKTLDKIWVKDRKPSPEDWENGHRAGWNDCIEYLDDELKSLLQEKTHK
jgi:hypothetical protein